MQVAEVHLDQVLLQEPLNIQGILEVQLMLQGSMNQST